MKPKATTFCFDGYQFNKKENIINFKYRILFSNQRSISFTEKIVLPKAIYVTPQKTLEKFLVPLSLILGISYYKLYCPSKIETKYPLSKEQSEFWNTVYKKGLGEFLFQNNLNPKKLARFPFKKINTNPIRIEVKDRSLLGIGGGKDSLVSYELLKDQSITPFLIESGHEDHISRNVISKIGIKPLIIRRYIDPAIMKKYEGSYNGHVPISAVFAFLGLLSACLYKYKYVVVSNEHSSNFGENKYKGEIINHQWSKSAEFESMLQDYTKKFISPDIVYFSLLRQFYEIRIAKLFSKHKKYFELFSSCNKNFKVFKDRPNNLWCGECAKCAFVFLILSPFLSKKELLSIFKKNYFQEEKNIPMYRDLLGFGVMKPFDCVGTFEESQAALFLASKFYSDDIVIKTFISKIKNGETLVKKVMSTAMAPTLPTQFRFLGIDNVCIVGYGKEGKITESFIKKYYPNLRIGILDKNIDEKYLERQSKYDLAIKTPGIQKNKITIPYTTATNMFFSLNKNLTIGVTGSKGKSTTTSLIYEILKTGNKKVRLLGNIGHPMLEVFLTKINPKEIFVLELSSYMLDDIEYSPNIAVLLNKFPEHMNYHDGVDNYYKAKEKIFAFQKLGDTSIIPPFKKTFKLNKKDIQLLGAHNRSNIEAAIKVANIFDVSDLNVKKTIKRFKPLPHRLEHVGKFQNIDFYDDAISTTPDSTIIAIKTLKKVNTILLGGEDRGYDFKKLEEIIREYNIKNVVLFPDSGMSMFKSKKGLNILETKNMEDAVAFAFKNTQKGKICLLSTASPSYSLWKNFEEKGDLFQKCIKSSIVV